MCFAFFAKNSKFKMAAPKNFSDKLGLVDDLDTLWVENFDEIALSCSVKEIAKFLCFAFFTKNSKIQNGGSKKFFGQMGTVDDLDTLWAENFNNLSLSHYIKGIEAIKVLTAGRNS